MWGPFHGFRDAANALSSPPGEYGRKAKTQRNSELAGENAAAVAAALHKRDASDSAVVDFLNAAEGVEVVDSTELDFPQTIDAVLTVIERIQGAHRG